MWSIDLQPAGFAAGKNSYSVANFLNSRNDAREANTDAAVGYAQSLAGRARIACGIGEQKQLLTTQNTLGSSTVPNTHNVSE